MENIKPLSEDVLKKLISPNAKALSKPGGIEKPIVDKDPDEYDDFSDDMFLAETYNEAPTQVSKDYQYDPKAAQILESRKNTDYSSNDFNPERLKNSGMLSAIKQEMINHPIDTTALNTQLVESAKGGMSRFDKMIAGAKEVDQRAKAFDKNGTPGKSEITETRNTGMATGGIDYALIKTIVNECLETKLNELAQKGLLNEGTTLKGIGLSDGKIKLVDNQGRVFVAKLEYKGNTKEKK